MLPRPRRARVAACAAAMSLVWACGSDNQSPGAPSEDGGADGGSSFDASVRPDARDATVPNEYEAGPLDASGETAADVVFADAGASPAGDGDAGQDASVPPDASDAASPDAYESGALDASGEGASDVASADVGTDASPGSDASQDAAGNDAGDGPSEPPPATTPAIPPMPDIVIPENTILQPVVHKHFTVTDPGGFAGLTVTASTTDTAHVQLGTPSCTGGDCTVDVKVIPTIEAFVPVTLTARNASGNTGTGTFTVEMSAHYVGNGNDSGPSSLRSMVANSTAGDVIKFAAGITKVQLASELDIVLPLSIVGPGAASLTIDGGGAYQAIATRADPVNISGVTITNATVAVVAFGGTLSVSDCTLTKNLAFGFDIAASAGMTVVGHVARCTISNNTTGAIASVQLGAGTASIDFVDSTFTGNSYGIGADVNAAGQSAVLTLNGGNKVQANTNGGVLLSIEPSDAGSGTVALVAPGGGGAGTNVVSNNPVGVRRTGPVPSSAITLTPASQVSSNTTDFLPAWP